MISHGSQIQRLLWQQVALTTMVADKICRHSNKNFWVDPQQVALGPNPFTILRPTKSSKNIFHFYLK